MIILIGEKDTIYINNYNNGHHSNNINNLNANNNAHTHTIDMNM